MATLHTLRSKTPPGAPDTGISAPVPGRNFDDTDMPPPLPDDNTPAAGQDEAVASVGREDGQAPQGVSSDILDRIYVGFEDMRRREEIDAPLDLVDRPQGFSGQVVAASEFGVAVRNGGGISYVPMQLFGEPAPTFEVGQPLSLVLEDRDGTLQARVLDRIGPMSSPYQYVDAWADSREPADTEDAAPSTADPGKPKSIAPVGAAELSPEQIAAAARQMAENTRGTGSGSRLDNPLVQKTALGALAASAVLATGAGGLVPALAAGVLVAGGGSLALAGLKKAGAGVQQVLETGRTKVSDVLAKQVNSLSADIERDTNWLRAHGMESIVTQMKDTGRSMREVLPQMQRGGLLEHLGFQMKGMLAEPEFAQRYQALEANLTRFGLKADRYAKTMVALGRDPESFLEAQTDRVGKAVEGMPIEKDGKFSALTEKVAEIAESIKAVINKIMGRMAPGRN